MFNFIISAAIIAFFVTCFLIIAGGIITYWQNKKEKSQAAYDRLVAEQEAAKPKNYTYHVVHYHKTKEGLFGQGSITVSRNAPISSAEDIQSIQNHIKTDLDVESVVIINWVLISETKGV